MLSDPDYLSAFLSKTADSMFYDLNPAPRIDVNARDYESNTVLDYACLWGDLRAVQLLVDAGTDIDAAGDMDVTPLHSAVRGRFLDIVEFLLLHGARQTKDAFGYTPLEWAMQMDYKEIVCVLQKQC